MKVLESLYSLSCQTYGGSLLCLSVNMQIHHSHNYIPNVTQTNFLGLIIDDTLSWKQHTDQLIKRMSSASYALRQVKYSLPIETLKIIYFAHVHTIMSYGVIFWGNSSCAERYLNFKRKLSELLQIPDRGIPAGKSSGTCK